MDQVMFSGEGLRWSRTQTYVEIAKEHYIRFQAALAEVDRIEAQPAFSEDEASLRSHEAHPHETVVRDSGLIVVAFVAFAVEAHIYDYAARRLGQGFTSTFLEKLETKAKWVVVTNMITSKEFPRDGQAFEYLSKLIRNRNEIVHYKSRRVEIGDSHSLTAKLNLSGRAKDFRESVEDAMRTLSLLSETAKTIDPSDWIFANALSPD